MTATAERKPRAPRAAPKHESLDPIAFATTWDRCDTLDEFLELTSYSRSGAQSRAKSYRDKGIELKHYPRKANTARKLDVEAINAAIRAARG